MLEGGCPAQSCLPRRLNVTAGSRGVPAAKASDSAFVPIYTIRGSYGKERQGPMAMVLNHNSGGLHRSVEMRRRWLLRFFPAGAFGRVGLHPLESAAWHGAHVKRSFVAEPPIGLIRP